jgi:aspartyl-tRNA synthetase
VKYAAACITDFPLFYRDENSKLCSVHHPFTAPKECDLAKNPEEMTALHYDFVLDGMEIGGGSVRVHNAELQRRIFQDWLKLDQSEFTQFLEALSLGAPPHAGIAIGSDKLLAVLLECKSIKQVLAFPKNNQGYDACFDFPEREDCKDQLLSASNYS